MSAYQLLIADGNLVAKGAEGPFWIERGDVLEIAAYDAASERVVLRRRDGGGVLTATADAVARGFVPHEAGALAYLRTPQ